MYIVLYIASILIANLTAATFFTVGPFTLAVGTLFFGATFTLRDHIHRVYGKNTAYKAIAAVVTLSILQSIFLEVPARIIVASAIAIFISEFTDTQIYHSLLQRSWALRVTSSNAVSTLLDSMLFSLIAFLGVLPASVLVSKIVTDILAKYVVSLLVIGYRRNTATMPL